MAGVLFAAGVWALENIGAASQAGGASQDRGSGVAVRTVATDDPAMASLMDVAVIQAALRELFTVREHAARLVVWQDSAASGPVFARLHAQSLSLSVSEQLTRAEPSDAFPLPVDVVSLDTLNTLFRDNPDGWEAFFARYPRNAGLVEIGRVQFDAPSGARADTNRPGPSPRTASVLVARTCGEHCAVAWRVTLRATATIDRPSSPPAWAVTSIVNIPLPAETAETRFVSAPDLRVIGTDAFTVLDVRGWWDFWRGHVPGAVRINWLDYRDGWGRTGRLPDDLDALARELGTLGVSASEPVLVYGDAADGWGEEGRIAWMLRYLGHPDVMVLDGGYDAWLRAGGAESHAQAAVRVAQFEANPNTTLRATEAQVALVVNAGVGSVSDTTPLLVDTRSDGEWNGSWKYFPSRTGRIPGAIHLRWQDLLTDAGTLDRSPAAIARLRALGITPDRPVITYCVGGVRSAFVALALRALGVRDVRNYDGSWYEWSADHTQPVEHPA